MRGTTNVGTDWEGRRDQVATLVALEVLLLWPRGVGPSPVTAEEAGRWPVFVLVVGERPRAEIPSAEPLFDLLDAPRLGGEMALVTGHCRWSIVDPRNALLKVAVRAQAPRRFELDVLVPARRVLGVLDVVARGATIGVTTSRHVGKLTGRVDIRQALHELVLIGCEPSTELATMADLLRRTGPAD